MRWLVAVVVVSIGVLAWEPWEWEHPSRSRIRDADAVPAAERSRVESGAASSQEPPSVDVAKPRELAVRVRLRDRNKKLVRGVEIELHRGEGCVARARTGADGVAVFRNLRRRFFVAISHGVTLGGVRPHATRIEDFQVDAAVHDVRLQVECSDGRSPPDLEFQNLFGVKRAPDGTVTGRTLLDKAGGQTWQIRVTAAGYRPQAVQVGGRPRHERVVLERAVRVDVLTSNHSDVATLHNLGGELIEPRTGLKPVRWRDNHWYRRTYYLAPGGYEFRSAVFEIRMATLPVPDIYHGMEVVILNEQAVVLRAGTTDQMESIPFPSKTIVSVEAEEPVVGATITATLGDRRLKIGTGSILLPEGKPVTIHASHKRWMIEPASITVRQFTRRVTFRARRGSEISFVARGRVSDLSGRVLAFAPGQDAPVYQAELDTRWIVAGHQALARYAVDPGRYDIWVVPRFHRPFVVRNVALTGGDVGLGSFQLEPGVSVRVLVRKDAELGRLVALARPHYVRSHPLPASAPNEDGTYWAAFKGCQPGPHEWRRRENVVRFIVPDVKEYDVAR